MRVQILPSPKTQSETAKEQADEQAKTTEKWWTIGIGIVTAVILAFQLWVFGLQARRLRETVVKMEEIATAQTADMKASINEATRAATAIEGFANTALHNMQINVKAMRASRRSAYAAKRSVEVAAGSLELTRQVERAWVSLETLDLENFTEAGRHGPQQPRAVIGLKNSGHTPATINRAKVILWTKVPLPDDPPYETVNWASFPNGAPPSHLVANETTRWRYFFPNPITSDIYDAMTALGIGGQVWIFGVIEYSDQFHPSKIRTYKFAREYDPWLTDKPLGRRWAHLHNPKYSQAD